MHCSAYSFSDHTVLSGTVRRCVQEYLDISHAHFTSSLTQVHPHRDGFSKGWQSPDQHRPTIQYGGRLSLGGVTIVPSACPVTTSCVPCTETLSMSDPSCVTMLACAEL
jgi:hypothetical protein